MAERFLVTGAMGCIGAWTVKQLCDEGVAVWTYDLPGTPHRWRLIMDDATIARVGVVAGDIADERLFERTVVDKGITHLVHLAALQVPFVRADPIGGARVNIVGTAVVFEAARRHVAQLRGLSYASSVGVYGAAGLYPAAPLHHDAPPAPTNLYGVYKQANEGMARIYWEEHRLATIGLRPYVVYGPGRDQGVTSTPTKAMLAAAVGRPYHISYGGRAVFQYAPDAAAVFVRAARAACEGASVYNLGGSSATMEQIVAAIEAAAPEVAGRITFDPKPLPHPADVDSSALDTALGPTAWTPLADGVRHTVERFRAGAVSGRLDVDKVLA